MKTALISVYNKEGIVEFARELVALDFKILASGGTAKELSSAGIEVIDVASLVGGEAILGHRVVTLSREVHAGLLARDIPEDRAELEKNNIPWIDLVCVDLYPLQEEINRVISNHPAPSDGAPLLEKEGKTARDSVIEKTDIGGPTMLRSAAKGRRVVVCDPADRQSVISWLKNGEKDRENFITSLAAKAEAVVADYCLVSARYHGAGEYEGLVGHQVAVCKYGENAYQAPAGLYGNLSFNPSPQEGRETHDDSLALPKFKILAGTAPSYNNWADVDRLLQTITHIAAGFDVNRNTLSALRASPPKGESSQLRQGFVGQAAVVPMIAVGVKHGNSCGVAVSDDPSLAIQKMLEGDLRAIFGGLVMVNFPVDEKLAEVLLTHKMESGRRLLDGIIAPSFTSGAIDLLKRKGDKCRFMVNPALLLLSKDSLDCHYRFRYVRGGFLAQPNYTFLLDLQKAEIVGNVGNKEINEIEKSDLVLAWAVGSTSNSNTVTIVKDGMLLGNGVGQQDRVGCCQLAIKRATDAGHNVTGAVAYSDSFFPFVDGVQTLADAGIKAIFATSGSVRDREVKDFCKEKDIGLYLIPDSEARGFFGH
jgi:phosphoribosylaminoimidazolecarboxamide formyltransferase/IMP cyclohydrolase